MARFHAIVDDVVTVDVECVKCGRGSTARVKSRGLGGAASFVGFDRGAAEQRALEQAREDVTHQARLTMSLVRCAHCGHRSRRETAWFVGLRVVGTLFMVGFVAVAWWLRMPWWAIGMLSLGAVAVPVQAYRRFHAVSSLVLSVQPRAILPPATVVSGGAPLAAAKTRAPSPSPEPSETPRLLR